MPSEQAVPSTLGKEKHNEPDRKSSNRPRKGNFRGPGTTGGPWPARETAPLVSTSLQTHYDEELDAIQMAYPGTQVWHQDDGLWLLTKSSLVTDLRQAAIFLTGISYAQSGVKAWGFWTHPLASATWIGPRHTNFPDGSICAFHPTDGTWLIGDPIVQLLDLYSVWAVRHLHLTVVGRWPGPQAVIHPYERILFHFYFNSALMIKSQATMDWTRDMSCSSARRPSLS